MNAANPDVVSLSVPELLLLKVKNQKWTHSFYLSFGFSFPTSSSVSCRTRLRPHLPTEFDKNGHADTSRRDISNGSNPNFIALLLSEI